MINDAPKECHLTNASSLAAFKNRFLKWCWKPVFRLKLDIACKSEIISDFLRVFLGIILSFFALLTECWAMVVRIWMSLAFWHWETLFCFIHISENWLFLSVFFNGLFWVVLRVLFFLWGDYFLPLWRGAQFVVS